MKRFVLLFAALLILLPVPATADPDDSTIFRKNVSKTPELTSAKAKFNVLPVWCKALKSDGTPVTLEYHDDAGNLLFTRDKAKPLVCVYADEHPDTGAHDVFLAISRDDGETWKRINISRSADLSSFTLADGTEYPGHCKKPVFHAKGKYIFVAWTSKYARGGKPTYAIDKEDDYPYDDPYWEDDIWGVGGNQDSITYDEEEYPGAGEVPFSAVWACRASVNPKDGAITVYMPERVTSGRRDANQIFMGGGSSAGFAIAWQEDPAGLRPGKYVGPGEGWSGATVNHKTDIWYSYITWSDFAKIDQNFVSGGEGGGNEDGLGREKALVPLSLPVRVTDNDVVNTENMKVELGPDGLPVEDSAGNYIPVLNDEGEPTGTHRYGYLVDGLCTDFYTFTNEQGAERHVCVTADQRLLDGDTGAARVNLFLQPYTKKLPDGTETKSAWAILGYEETKGAGSGAPDHDEGGPHGDDYTIEEGKNVHYHSFDFTTPDLVHPGKIVNRQAVDPDTGIPLILRDEAGDPILDWQGNTQPAYENARRVRFILQGKSAIGDSRTVMCIIYKEGEEGQGGPSDIMLHRVKAPDKGNPYAPKNIQPGVLNMSSFTPTETEENSDDPDKKGAIKVVRFEQTEANLADRSWANPYEDSRAHRGQIRGDFIVMGFCYTPNWAASRNANDKYDFYVRRSFDGGVTWTTDPKGSGVSYVQMYKDRDTKELVEYTVSYGPGQFEPARNLSMMRNNKESVIEPRLVAAPGTIKKDGVWTGIAEDKQNKNVFFVAYGTEENLDSESSPVPLDLYYSFSMDRGETYKWVEKELSSSGEIVMVWDWLAKKQDMQEGECQVRMTPAGTRFYASWLGEGDDPTDRNKGSDIWMRRIMNEPLKADVNADQSVDWVDIMEIYYGYGPATGPEDRRDLNGDGWITLMDLITWYSLM